MMINDKRLAHLQSIMHTEIGLEEFGLGITSDLTTIVFEPDAFTPEFY